MKNKQHTVLKDFEALLARRIGIKYRAEFLINLLEFVYGRVNAHFLIEHCETLDVLYRTGHRYSVIYVPEPEKNVVANRVYFEMSNQDDSSIARALKYYQDDEIDIDPACLIADVYDVVTRVTNILFSFDYEYGYYVLYVSEGDLLCVPLLSIG